MESAKKIEDVIGEVTLQIDVQELPPELSASSEDACESLQDGEPSNKRLRPDDDSISMDDSTKDMLFSLNKTICSRLDVMERKFVVLSRTCHKIDRKLDSMKAMLARAAPQLEAVGPTVHSIHNNVTTLESNTVVVGHLPQGDEPTTTPNALYMNNSVTLLTLNTKEDYPHGSWLGDETSIEQRVRCPIPPADMLHIMGNSKSPEKCALRLLDHLFDRETQASSNLSGKGRHEKHRLDPLMIYGLRCHLVHHYSMTEYDWQRIRINIDSKCRTAFTRKLRGLPLAIKMSGYKSALHNPTEVFAERVIFPGQSAEAVGMNDCQSSEVIDHTYQHEAVTHIELPIEEHITEILVQEGDEQQDDSLQKVQITVTEEGEIEISNM